MSTAEPSRSAPLDGLRGVAVLMVMFHHTILFLFPQFGGRLVQFLGSLGDEGWIGVDLFFVLSGFLITRILLLSRDKPRYYLKFYARRTLRIFPLYYLFITFTLIFLPWLLPGNEELQREVPHQGWYWLYVPNLRIFLHGGWISRFTDQTWSLAIEEQFYLVWPFLVATLSARALGTLAAFVLPLGLWLRVAMVHAGLSNGAVRAFTLTHLDGLMLGALLALAVVSAVPRATLRRLSGALLASGLLGRALILNLGMDDELARSAYFVTLWSMAFAGALGFVVTAEERSWLARALSARGLVFFGTYSYGLYLFHQPIFMFVSQALEGQVTLGLQGWLALAATAGPLSIGAAYVLFHLYEQPFLRLKARF